MASFNKVIVMGYLTRDPELRFVPSGIPVANFGLAVNRRYQDAQGDTHEEVTFFEVTAWGKTAEVSAEYLIKGSPVLIEGRLRQERWETEDGEKRSLLKVVAERVRFLPRSERPEGAPGEDEGEVPF